MRFKTYLDLAQAEMPGATSSALIQRAIELLKMNGESPLDNPFCPSDIALLKFVEFCQDYTSERERCLIIISNLLENVHREMHISVQVMKEPMSPQAETDARNLKKALEYFDLGHLIEDELNEQTLNLWRSL